MSTTPRTQAATKTNIWNGVKHIFVDAAVCCQLETELTAALQLQAELQSALQSAREELATVTAERDALKAELGIMTEDRDSEARWAKKYFDDWQSAIAALTAIRDALKAVLQHYIDEGLIVRRDGEK